MSLLIEMRIKPFGASKQALTLQVLTLQETPSYHIIKFNNIDYGTSAILQLKIAINHVKIKMYY
ncbi:MAG: hypothetical protein B6242_07000 [Anaerolineaceae bacterium 4572_78]|nr:MAG: hypothetical protein B6242_07000 [Anaerolineaceae bacterium 4572_78]